MKPNDRSDDPRVAVYGRVSSEEQARPDKSSLKQQEKRVRALCDAHEWEATEVYRDVVTGTKWDRPQLQAMLEAAKQGMFGRVVFLALDRLARNLHDLLDIHEKLSDAGVGLVSVKEAFDTSTPVGKLVFSVLGAIAEFEVERQQERMTDGRVGRVERGKYQASIVPYGYSYKPCTCPPRHPCEDPTHGVLTPHPDHADIVTEIYRLAVEEHLGLSTIAHRLNDRGTPPPNNSSHPLHKSNHGWHTSTIQRILTAERYTGDGTYKSPAGEVAMTCPPLIDIATFEAARDHFKRRQRTARAHPKHIYLLGGLVKCRHCGSHCSGTTSGGRDTLYYACNKSRRYGAKEHGGKGLWPAKLVEPPVQRWLLELLSDPQEALSRAEVAWQQQDAASAERARERRRLEDKLTALDNEEENAETAHVRGRLSEAALVQQQGRITSERAQTRALIDELAQAGEQRTVSPAHRNDVLEVFKELASSKWAEWSHEDVTDEEYYDAHITHGDRAKWQGFIRDFVSTVWLEQDGSVTVEGVLPSQAASEVAVTSPRS